MKTQSMDTSSEVEKLQFDLLRKAGARRRLQLARAHTRSATNQGRRRIARTHPEWSDLEVRLHWASLVYGEELVADARRELQRRGLLKNG
jgi:hypothetical protein